MGYVEMGLYPSKYNENMVRRFYEYLFDGGDNIANPSFGAVYMGGILISFTLNNITYFMSVHITMTLKAPTLKEMLTGTRLPMS